MLVHEELDLYNKVEGIVVGIEVEFENARRVPPVAYGWYLDEDPSLRNSGIECKTGRPVTQAEANEMIDLLYEEIVPYCGYTAHTRTGTHVHINGQMWNRDQLYGVLATYAVVEPLLYAYCGKEREENIYCIPWYFAKDQLRLAKRAKTKRLYVLADSCKYSGLYLGPLCNFGTIEFRMAPTWMEAQPLKDWVDMLLRLTAYGTGLEKDEFVVENYLDQPEKTLTDIFGEEHYRTLQSITGRTSPIDLISEYDSLKSAELLQPCMYNVAYEDEWDTYYDKEAV